LKIHGDRAALTLVCLYLASSVQRSSNLHRGCNTVATVKKLAVMLNVTLL